jgi:Cytochrome c7 and related cytochrome c
MRRRAWSPNMSWLLALGPLVGLFAACATDGDEGPGVYVGANWQDARDVVGHRVHVVGEKIACAACHSFATGEVDRPGVSVCVPCHEGESRIEHGTHGAAGADCGACHAFLPTASHPAGIEAWDCMRCHAETQGEAPAVSIHAKSTCETCHRPHEDPSAEPSRCTGCHEDVTTNHAAPDGTAPQESGAVCATCHQDQHAPAKAARATCAPCHGDNDPIIPASATFEGHDTCIACHRPHDVGRDKPVACRSCHEDTPVLGAGRIAEHATCEGCHDPHAPSAELTRACVSCHTKRQTDHPAAKGTETCSTCHSPHPPMGRKSPARACSNCHHDATEDSAFHGAKTTCRDCHRPHQFSVKLSNQALCVSCHLAPVSAVAGAEGHADCRSCHAGLPHQPAAGTSDCNGCHADQARTAAEGHRACRNCHEPHGGNITASCTTCHADQHQAAPAGHRACSSCHADAHAAQVTKSCTTCHADKTSAAHSGVEGGCDSCHSAHGARGATASPSCASCHPTSDLVGLHQTRDHQACSQCHTSTHDTALRNERALCSTCHRGLEDHEPKAPRCVSCHLFR